MRTESACVTLALSLAVCIVAQASTLDRDSDPVVLVGGDLPTLVGLAVDRVVAFKYDDGWAQIPVQIDERKVVDYGVVYDDSPIGVTTLAYTDPNTYCGSDTDSAFDADDELVFMAKDAGGRAALGAGEPAGVVAGSGVELEITDSLDAGLGYVYLFETDGSLALDAGQDYVTYVFNLLAGEYIPNYKTNKGPNPEDSEVYSAYYRTHFADRWIRDELNVYAGGATGVDIFDRHKNLFAPGYCQRSEDTFCNGEGAFFVNKDGPVRALRSYMGANSGPLTQRVHRFYERRQDVATHLRVHSIPAMTDFYDYSPAATGMSYFNDLNLTGVLIDGVPESITGGQIMWEMVTGAQGSVLISHQADTDISSFAYTSYYQDDVDPPATQCTGDDYEYGASGLFIMQTIPNTDPRSTPFNILAATRIVRYAAPGQTTTDAALHHDHASMPLSLAVQTYEPAYALTLIVVNGGRAAIDFDPEPEDANQPAYPVDTVVTLTAQPPEGRAFDKWTIRDPNHPADANFARQDTNQVLSLVMDSNRRVTCTFKCGSGIEQALPLLVIAAGLCAASHRARRRC